MSFPPTTTVFNDGYIAETYEAYRRDPASVDESWRQFFRFAQSIGGGGSADTDQLRKAAGAAALAEAIREYGHLGVQIDPLGTPPPGAIELTADFHRLTDDDLRALPASVLAPRGGAEMSGTALEAIERLREATGQPR